MRNEDRVIDYIERNPKQSQKEISRALGIPATTVHRILKEFGYHPYHYVRVQELLEKDHLSRTEFCEWFLDRHNEDEHFIDRILFTDESTFGRLGLFNIHNEHHYAEENPHLSVVRSTQTRCTVNVWAGLIGNRVVKC